MININRIEAKEIKKFFQRLPGNLGKHTFLIFLILWLLSMFLGGFSFYKYGILALNAEPQIAKKPLQLEEKVYNRVLQEWENRGKRFEESDTKIYPDPFREIYFEAK